MVLCTVSEMERTLLFLVLVLVLNGVLSSSTTPGKLITVITIVVNACQLYLFNQE